MALAFLKERHYHRLVSWRLGINLFALFSLGGHVYAQGVGFKVSVSHFSGLYDRQDALLSGLMHGCLLGALVFQRTRRLGCCVVWFAVLDGAVRDKMAANLVLVRIVFAGGNSIWENESFGLVTACLFDGDRHAWAVALHFEWGVVFDVAQVVFNWVARLLLIRLHHRSLNSCNQILIKAAMHVFQWLKRSFVSRSNHSIGASNLFTSLRPQLPSCLLTLLYRRLLTLVKHLDAEPLIFDRLLL